MYRVEPKPVQSGVFIITSRKPHENVDHAEHTGKRGERLWTTTCLSRYPIFKQQTVTSDWFTLRTSQTQVHAYECSLKYDNQWRNVYDSTSIPLRNGDKPRFTWGIPHGRLGLSRRKEKSNTIQEQPTGATDWTCIEEWKRGHRCSCIYIYSLSLSLSLFFSPPDIAILTAHTTNGCSSFFFSLSVLFRLPNFAPMPGSERLHKQ